MPKQLNNINPKTQQLDLFKDVKPQPKSLEKKMRDKTNSKKWLIVNYQPVSLFSLKHQDR